MKITYRIFKFLTTCLHPNAISRWIELGHPAFERSFAELQNGHDKQVVRSFLFAVVKKRAKNNLVSF